ncbi:mismatch-specific DNA-glycosylase [Terrihabitans sp. B22-R8]|uniref:mismatch-specific DNA-glycosylase n=1 Tax=Terrihabitans sp. B22-R8 TaxID=3425128 RepID=UPI00403C1D07
MILPDFLAPDLDLVLCGTAPGPVSAARGHYYANPGNKFWRTLHAVGLTPRLLRPDEDSLLPTYGIGLTDLVKTRSGLDRDLARGDYDVAGLVAKIEHFAPKTVAFDSLNAGRRVLGAKARCGLQGQRIGATEIFILPSPSGLASGHWDIVHWQDLARHLGRAPIVPAPGGEPTPDLR